MTAKHLLCSLESPPKLSTGECGAIVLRVWGHKVTPCNITRSTRLPDVGTIDGALLGAFDGALLGLSVVGAAAIAASIQLRMYMDGTGSTWNKTN